MNEWCGQPPRPETLADIDQLIALSTRAAPEGRHAPPEDVDLVAALVRARDRYAHEGDGSALMALAGLLEQAGDYERAASLLRIIARTALNRLAELHERHGRPGDADPWRRRAQTLEEPTKVIPADQPGSGNHLVGGDPAQVDASPPPRVVSAQTRVVGHTANLLGPGGGSTTCSCGWRAGDRTQPTVADHLRDAWPVIAPREPGESLRDWQQRLSHLLELAMRQERDLWNKYGMGKPVQPGQPFPFLRDDYVRSDDRVQVLTWQLEQTRQVEWGRLSR